MSIIVQKHKLSELDVDKINNNNLKKDMDDLDARTMDYETELKKTHLSSYANLINYPIKFSYEFTKPEIAILKQACQVSIITSQWPKILDEELNAIYLRLKESWIEGRYFIRLDSCSVKDSNVECPIINPKDLIMSLITSKRVLTAFKVGYNKIYFIDYNSEFDSAKEVRVFVRNRKVTCITQYQWNNIGYFNNFTNDQLICLAKKIIDDVENNLVLLVCDKINTNDFTIDYLVKEDMNIKIIELNSFGYWLAAGSCLFSWIVDRDILYDKNNENNVYFRILE